MQQAKRKDSKAALSSPQMQLESFNLTPLRRDQEQGLSSSGCCLLAAGKQAWKDTSVKLEAWGLSLGAQKVKAGVMCRGSKSQCAPQPKPGDCKEKAPSKGKAGEHFARVGAGHRHMRMAMLAPALLLRLSVAAPPAPRSPAAAPPAPQRRLPAAARTAACLPACLPPAARKLRAFTGGGLKLHGLCSPLTRLNKK
ncbi:uncharacterized protein LOC135189469 isoform X2 [Pogoniulus pusillus]